MKSFQAYFSQTQTGATGYCKIAYKMLTDLNGCCLDIYSMYYHSHLLMVACIRSKIEHDGILFRSLSICSDFLENQFPHQTNDLILDAIP